MPRMAADRARRRGPSAAGAGRAAARALPVRGRGARACTPALLDVQESVSAAALDDRPAAGRRCRPGSPIASLPRVVEVTEAAGPPALAAAVARPVGAEATVGGAGRRLAGRERAGTGRRRYLARAACGPVLAALGPAAGASTPADAARRAALPALRRPAAARLLQRGGRGRWSAAAAPAGLRPLRTTSWRPRAHDRARGLRRAASTARGCRSSADEGEATVPPPARRGVRRRCQRYLLDVELGRDPAAVPEVDELAALPLDLYAAEQGTAQDHAQPDGVLMVRSRHGQDVRLLHRHERLHRLQGLRGGLQGVEPARRQRAASSATATTTPASSTRRTGATSSSSTSAGRTSSVGRARPG